MSFDDVFDIADDLIFDACGVDATFTPTVGDAVECKVNFVIDTSDEPYTESKVWGSNKTIEAILDVIGKEPDKGETFTINFVVYTVQKVIANDGRFVTVAVK